MFVCVSKPLRLQSYCFFRIYARKIRFFLRIIVFFIAIILFHTPIMTVLTPRFSFPLHAMPVLPLLPITIQRFCAINSLYCIKKYIFCAINLHN